MLGRTLGLNSQQALLATKSCLAIIVAYALALRLNWNASYVATTIIVLQTAAVGTTLHKASLRMIGTLAGALIGLALVGTCAHDRELFILSMVVLTGICVWGMQTSANQYAWMLAMLTAAIVGWPSVMNPLDTFQTAVDRVTAVTLGVILSGLAQTLLWPTTAASNYEQTMRRLLKGCREVLRLTRRGFEEGQLDTSALDQVTSELMTLSTSLDPTLQAARVDSRRFRKYFDGYQELSNDLVELHMATAAMADTLRSTLAATDGSVVDHGPVHQFLDRAEQQCEATISQLTLPRDGSQPPEHDLEPSSADEAGSSITPETSLLANQLDGVSVAAAHVCKSLSAAESAVVARPLPTTGGAKPPIGTRLAKSALASLQVIAAAWFFILLNWPLGLQSSMIVVMILAFMNAQLPVALLARTILSGVICALPLAAVFHFLIMPGLDSFAQLSPWLALFFLPYLYAMASRNPLTGMAALMSIIIAKSLISVSTTPPSYSFATFANTYIGMSGGFSLVLLLAYFMETRSPRRGFHKLLTALLTRAANDLASCEQPVTSGPDDETAGKTNRRTWLQQVGKLKKLSATVDYRQDPRTGRDQIGKVLKAYDVLGLRVGWTPAVVDATESLDNDDQQALDSFRDWCTRAITTTRDALTEGHEVVVQRSPVEVLPALESPTSRDARHGRESQAILTAHYRSLADAIVDCQHELSAVNWKRWYQSYF